MTAAMLALAAVLAASAATPGIRFADATEELGLSWRMVAGSAEKRFIPEAMPGGVAWLDHDLDGDWDLFLVQGGTGTPPTAGAKDSAPADAGASPSHVLLRNMLVETGHARFEDVTDQVGLSDGGRGGWGMGVSAADPDGDGDVDLFVTRLGVNQFFRNDLVTPSGRAERPSFTEVAAELGLARSSWSTGAAFGDVDGDGDLDLYVAGYVDFDPSFRPPEKTQSHWRGIDVFPGPVGLPPAKDTLYRNLLAETGRCTFRDDSEAAGIRTAGPYYGFAVLMLDLDGDGDLDVHVANDSTPNQLYRNDGKGRFRDDAFAAGVAFSEDGKTQAGMGSCAGDCDGDGRPDLFVTNFSYDYYTLQRNLGRGLFEDVSYASGVGTATYHALGFGAVFLDADLDGDEDLFVANGHIYPQVDLRRFKTTYAQRNQLFENVGPGCRFVDRTVAAGTGLAVQKVSRGCAAADMDGDGDLDLAVNELDERPTILRNESGRAGSWLAVRVEGRAPNRFGIGARVEVRSGGEVRTRWIQTSASYLGSPPPVAHVGLGSAERADVTVHFPDGTRTERKAVAVGQTLIVRQPPAGG